MQRVARAQFGKRNHSHAEVSIRLQESGNRNIVFFHSQMCVRIDP